MANSARLGLTASLCQDLLPGGWFISKLFQPVQIHGVYIAADDMQLHVLLLYYIVPICRKLTVIYRQLGNTHLIQLLWVVFIHLELRITSATLGSKT